MPSRGANTVRGVTEDRPTSVHPPGDHALLFDADCGVCRWILAKLLAWDRARRLRPVALQDPEADRLLGEMDEERRMASWHFVDPSGRVSSAGDAFEPLLALLPAGRPAAAVARRVPAAARRFYDALAARRGQLGRLVTDGARRRADDRIAARSARPSR